MKQKIYYVTTNLGKFREVYEYVAKNDQSIDLEMLSLDIQEIQSNDQVEIAKDKAKKAWDLVQKPILIDDAAIYYERYNKFPGTLTKYVSCGIGFEGNMRLFDEGDKAYFLLQMVYICGGDEYHIFEGRCDGYLTKQNIGKAHPQLPYDAFFVPNGETRTYAELKKTSDYDQYIYRISALKKFLKWYKYGS